MAEEDQATFQPVRPCRLRCKNGVGGVQEAELLRILREVEAMVELECHRDGVRRLV